MQENFDLDRRRFFGTLAMTFAAAQLRTLASADAQSNAGESESTTTILTPSQGTHTSFSSLRQINAGLLNVGYAQSGPANGQAVILTARLALRYSQLRRRRSDIGIGGL